MYGGSRTAQSASCNALSLSGKGVTILVYLSSEGYQTKSLYRSWTRSIRLAIIAICWRVSSGCIL